MKLDPITKYLLKEGKNYTKPCALNSNKVAKVMGEWFKKEKISSKKIKPNTRFKEDLKMSESDIYDLVNYITTKFDVDLDDNAFDKKVKTINDFIKFFSDQKNVRCI